MMTKREAIALAGSQTRLARLLKIGISAISQWDEEGEIPMLREYQVRDLQTQGILPLMPPADKMRSDAHTN